MFRLRYSWREVEVGSRFHKLTVVGPQFRLFPEKGKPKWACVVQCDCGNHKIVYPSDLIRDFQKSCGCHRVDVGRQLGQRTTHGETGTPLHNCWHNIKLRCCDPNQPNYLLYGGRGITVCDEWKESYEVFRDYALAHGYKPGLQIDRYPNNDGNYEPGNIRFVTCKENNRNRRNTPFQTLDGETKCRAAWADDSRCRVSYDTLWERLRSGWPFHEALTRPPTPRGSQRRTIRDEVRTAG